MTWVRGGYEDPARVEKIALNLPDGVFVEDAPPGKTISDLLASGEVDAVIGPRAPSCFVQGHPMVKYLFEDPQASAAQWYLRTKIFPIMHMIGVRKTLLEAHPWLACWRLMKGFGKAKDIALARLTDTSRPRR